MLYIILMALSLALSVIIKPNVSKSNKLLYLIFMFGLFAFLTACRGATVGRDTIAYRNYFLWINREHTISPYEAGFTWLIRKLYRISKNPQILIFTTGLFSVIVVGYSVYKNSKDVVLSTFLFISLGIYDFFQTGVRQCLALALILVGIEFFKRKNYFIYIISVVMATLIHSSALVMLSILLISIKKIYVKDVSVSIIIAFFALFWGRDIFLKISNRLSVYDNYIGTKYDYGNKLSALLYFLMALVILIFYLYSYGIIQIKESKKIQFKFSGQIVEKDFFEKIMLFMEMAGVILLAGSVSFIMFSRLSEYFKISYIFLLPISISNLNSEKNKKTYRSCIMAISTIYIITIIIFRYDWLSLPYVFME